MAHYRVYRLVGGRIMEGQFYDCADDEAAGSRAVALLLEASPRWCDAVEIWQGTRLVGRIRRADVDFR
jgi:hypothetical protein